MDITQFLVSEMAKSSKVPETRMLGVQRKSEFFLSGEIRSDNLEEIEKKERE